MTEDKLSEMLERYNSELLEVISYLRDKSLIDEIVAETIIRCHNSEVNEAEFTEQIGDLVGAVERYKQDTSNQNTLNALLNAFGYFEEPSGDKDRLIQYGFIQPTTIKSLIMKHK